MRPAQRSTLRRALLSLWAVAVAATLVGAAIVLLHARTSDAPGYEYWLEPLVAMGVFTAVGVLLAARRPGHPVGTALLCSALAGGIQVLCGAYAHYALHARGGELPGGAVAALVATIAQVSFIAGLVALLYLFPTGGLPSPAWRWPAGAGLVGLGLHAVGFATAPQKLDIGLVPSPLAVGGAAAKVLAVVGELGNLLMVGALVGAFCCLITRFRRSRGDERLQLRWFVFGAVAGVVLILTLGELSDLAGRIAWGVGPSLAPLAAGVAILRYRLYDIDRVISRTLTYALVTTLLAAVYATLVAVVGLLAPAASTSPVAVAAATLAAAALFRPLRQRVQALVDRRFDRSHYDRLRTAATFRDRLRTEVDLDAVGAELVDTAGHAMQPRVVSLWLRRAGQ